MTYTALYRLAGLAAILGGLLRIGSSFELVQDTITLEWVYTTTDILLLMGLMGIYLIRAEKLGFLGLTSFGVGVAALSFIGGPDADPFGFNTYEQGAYTLAIALIGLSLAWLRVAEKPISPTFCWIGSVVAVGVFNLVPAISAYGFAAAGVLFGLGFVLAGIPLVRRT